MQFPYDYSSQTKKYKTSLYHFLAFYITSRDGSSSYSDRRQQFTDPTTRATERSVGGGNYDVIIAKLVTCTKMASNVHNQTMVLIDLLSQTGDSCCGLFVFDLYNTH